MIELKLTANGSDQKILLAHLTPLISDVLAEKINNGVRITKDGKELISKKDLDTFMEYLIDEIAKMKIAKKYKRANVAGMEGEDILNHAIHYFEEDSIEGKLYNLDGTEFVQPKPAKQYSAVSVVPVDAKTPSETKQKPQLSIFDMLSDKPEEKPVATVEDDDENDGEELNSDYTPEELEEIYAEEQTYEVETKSEPKKGSPMYQHYQSVKGKYKDCIVFYRLGDFYEMFGEDAIASANELNLTLTGRDCGLAERVPMTGIPYHAADVYISKLVSRGYKVAVAEPLDGKSERTVERVIAPNPPESEPLADEETGEILSESEMQKFDGDMEEPEELMTVSKLIGVTTDDNESDESDDDFDLEKERRRLKAFDKNALVILSDLLGNIFTLE